MDAALATHAPALLSMVGTPFTTGATGP